MSIGRLILGVSALTGALFAAAPARSETPPPVAYEVPANAAIASRVVVPKGYDLVFVSGMPSPLRRPDNVAPPGGYGDTEKQSTDVFQSIAAELAKEHLTMGDVVMMHVFLVGDPAKGGMMDFGGMMAAYNKFFGTKDQPHKPARTTVQVAGLVAPGLMVEIDVIAAKK